VQRQTEMLSREGMERVILPTQPTLALSPL
jgi:hypothetical protein